MAKKELRIYFNLENDNEKKLYEHLMSKTSASGYLKDLALDYLETRLPQQPVTDNRDIVEQLKKIGEVLSNLSVPVQPQGTVQSSKKDEFSDSSVVNDINMNNLDIDSIDFSDIDLEK